MSLARVAKVSDEQAALLVGTMSAQRGEIKDALDSLARSLHFRDRAGAALARSVERPDVLRVRHDGARLELFVGIARGFTEPVHELRHHELVRAWVRRFARLTDKRRGKAAPAIAGGYLIVGAYDDTSAFTWASLLTRMARPHRLQREGAPARFVVRKLGAFWMAC